MYHMQYYIMPSLHYIKRKIISKFNNAYFNILTNKNYFFSFFFLGKSINTVGRINCN